LLVSVLAILAVGLLAQSWRRFGLREVTYQRQFSERRLFPGEQTVLHMQLINRKILPLPWLGVSEEFSSGLRPVQDGERHGSVQRFTVRQSFTLGPFERVERDLPLLAVRRGYYAFSAVTAAAGDPFGLYRAEGTLGSREEVLVYPALLENWQYQVTAQQPFGEVVTRRPVWLDPARPAGVRDYIPGDQLRQLHWRATARLGRLQTRRYDPAAAVHLMIVLDVNTAEQAWRGVDHAVLEHAISVAASIARDAIENRLPVGLLANALSVNSDQTIRVPPGRSPDQLAAILEELARLVLYFGLPIGQLLERELPRLPVGAAVVLVSVLDSPDTDAAFAMVRHRGHPTYRCDPRERSEALEAEVSPFAR
jgi:uncharacterized protein (DUF58 family)